MGRYLESILHDFVTFYNSLSPLGLVLFYSVISIIVILIILIGVMERNRHLELNKKASPISTPIKVEEPKPVVNNDEPTTNNPGNTNINEIAKKLEQDMNIKLTKFEEDQEENSIISYEELLSKTNSYSLDKIKSPLTNKTFNDEVKPTTAESKFANSPLISPIYGISEEKPRELTNEIEKKVDIPKPNIEIKNNDEFLKALKEFRKSLD